MARKKDVLEEIKAYNKEEVPLYLQAERAFINEFFSFKQKNKGKTNFLKFDTVVKYYSEEEFREEWQVRWIRQ